MEFFITNIFNNGYVYVAIAIFFTIFSFVFLFLKKKEVDISRPLKETSPHELEIKLRAYERLALFLERIEPVSMLNRLELHNSKVDVLGPTLIKNIITEYEYNFSQQIYVSNTLWRLIETAKNKIIDSISSTSNTLHNDSSSLDFVEKLRKESIKNNLMLQKIKKILKEEVRNLS